MAKFWYVGRKCLEKTAGKEGKRIRNVQLASMFLSNKYKGIFETTKQGRKRRNKSAMHKRLNDYVRWQHKLLFYTILPTSFAPPLCTAKNLICKEKAKSIPSKSQICLERPSFSQYFLVKSARRQRRLELPKSLSAPVNVLRPD